MLRRRRLFNDLQVWQLCLTGSRLDRKSRLNIAQPLSLETRSSLRCRRVSSSEWHGEAIVVFVRLR